VLHDELDRSLLRDADARIALWLWTVRHEIVEYPEESLASEISAALPAEAVFEVWTRTAGWSRHRQLPRGKPPARAESVTLGNLREPRRQQVACRSSLAALSAGGTLSTVGDGRSAA